MDFVSRDACRVELHADRARRTVRHDGDVAVEVTAAEFAEGGVARFVVADGAHQAGVEPELCDVAGEVGRCAAEASPFGEHVPKHFAQGGDFLCVRLHGSVF